MKRKQHDSFSRFLMKLLCLMLAIVLAALAGAIIMDGVRAMWCT